MYALAPIILFTYNRPFHTQQVLNSLAINPEAAHSVLYIYCDGAKKGANEETVQKINETKEIIKNENRFKEIVIIEQPSNKGLANSIIDGVTEVVNKFGNVIVLEDDLILSPYFLFYMNDSLKRYENNLKVAQIGSCNFFAIGKSYPSSFFTTMTDCWGWATWQDRWKHFNPDGGELFKKLSKKKLMYRFNAYGSYDMEGMLKLQIEKKISSWAVRWQAVCILNDWLILYPNPSFSNHMESEDATHAGKNITPPLCKTRPSFKTIDTVEIPEVTKALKKGYYKIGKYKSRFGKEYFSLLKKAILFFSFSRFRK